MALYPKFKEIQQDNLILTYSGILNIELIAQLVRLAEATLANHLVHTRQKRCVVNVFIEALQNIHYHGSSKDSSDEQVKRDWMLLLTKEEESYRIITGNLIKNDAVSKLKKRLTKISDSSVEELTQLYLKTLQKGKISDKGGAGLGLVKIFIDSKKDTSFGFETIDKDYSFFTMKINVSK